MIEPTVAISRDAVIHPDASRVVTRLFVPGRELAGGHESRASNVVQRILALDDETVSRALDDVMKRFEHRNRDLRDIFREHAARIGNRLDAEVELSDDRWLLLGATFTHEYSIESVAACPSRAHSARFGAGRTAVVNAETACVGHTACR